MPIIETRSSLMAHNYCGCRHQAAAVAGSASNDGDGTGVFGGPSATLQYPPNLELEPVHLVIDIALDLARESMRGRVVQAVVSHNAAARSIELDAVDFHDVTVRDLSGKPVSVHYNGRKLHVIWGEVIPVGERRELEISYRIEKPTTGLFFMQPSTEYPDKALYAATDHETERARYWLPCIDLPNVRTTLDWRITADAKLTILANGALVSERGNNDGTKTAHWRLEQRCPSYLICFAVGDFVRFDDGDFEGLPVAYFCCRDFSADDLQRSFGRTKEMLGWMSKKLGVRYPFPKYYQFALPAFGGAMENISLVSWSDRAVLTAEHAAEASWLVDQTNIHEMAHSYFGDLVVCRDFAHAWLKESWATYMETCWLEDKYGRDEQLYDLYRNAHAYFNEADHRYSRPMVTRNFTSSWQMYDQHLYPGGACRLHTLRNEVGDAVFWRAVSDYLQTHREQVVETDDFRRIVEHHSGRSLQKFFDQWFFTAGYPSLKVSFSYDKDKALGSFAIEQKQIDEKKGIPCFELSTELGWVIDGKLHTQSIYLSKDRQSFHFRMDKEPEQVRFDPSGKILHKLEFNPGEDKLKAQLKNSKDVIGRIHAAMTLAETGKRHHVQLLLEAWRVEPFWGVRREIVKALEKAGTAEAVKALAEIVAKEQGALVLERVFESAAAFRDPALASAVQERLEIGGLAPSAKAAALHALGAQRERAPLALLKAAAQIAERHYGFAQAEALHALGMSRSEDGAAFLREQVAYGRVPSRARYGIAAGLAAAAPFLEKRSRQASEEALIDLLRDRDMPMRLAAAKALHAAHAKAAVQPLEAYRQNLPLQEQVVIDRFIATLQKGEEPQISALEKQLEDMQTKYRKLHERLQDLEDRMK